MVYHTVFHSFSLFPNCLRFLGNLCIIDPIIFEHFDHAIKTDQSESENFASSYFVTFGMFFHILLLPYFTPPSPLYPCILVLALPSYPLSSTVVHSMCAVLTNYFLRVHCSFLSFTSCALSPLTLFFMYFVHLLLTLDIEMKLRNVSKARHSFFCLETMETFNRCTVLACTKPKPSIFPEVYPALNVETASLLLNCRCGNVAAILELDAHFRVG